MFNNKRFSFKIPKLAELHSKSFVIVQCEGTRLAVDVGEDIFVLPAGIRVWGTEESTRGVNGGQLKNSRAKSIWSSPKSTPKPSLLECESVAIAELDTKQKL